jgi:hypothetical protein
MFGLLGLDIAIVIGAALALICEKPHAAVVEGGSLLHDLRQTLELLQHGIDAPRLGDGSN